MKRMNAIEHGIPKSKVAWVNVIASRCRCGTSKRGEGDVETLMGMFISVRLEGST